MVKEDYTFENNIIKIGENSNENDIIISNATQNDLWFHLANLPSCHVILSCSKNHKATIQMINYCANLVKENTKFKNLQRVKVHYVPIKNIRKTDVKGKIIINGRPSEVVI